MSSNLEKVKTKTEEFFEKIGVSGEITIEEKDGYFYLTLKNDEPASLIGYHGQTLESLQLILNLILTKHLGEYVKTVLDISDWRKRREDVLKEMAQKTAIKAKFSGSPQILSGLNAFERRIIHLVLQDHLDVITQSEGEGEERIIKILPKTKD